MSEIYDAMRVLFAKAGEVTCTACGQGTKQASESDLATVVCERFQGETVTILASIIDGHRGEFRKELSELAKQGINHFVIDGVSHSLSDDNQIPMLDPQKIHVVDAAITAVKIDRSNAKDVEFLLKRALQLGNGAVRISTSGRHERFSLKHVCHSCGTGIPEIGPRLFSFNSPYGACPTCKGLGVFDKIDQALVIADVNKTLRQGALVPTLPNGYIMYSQVTLEVLDQVCKAHGFSIDIPWHDLTPEHQNVVLFGSERIKVLFGKHPLENRLKWKGITAKPREEGFYKGIIPVMDEILKRSRNDSIMRFVKSCPCEDCHGTRLRSEARAVHLDGLSIADLAAMCVSDVYQWFEAYKKNHVETIQESEVLHEIIDRLNLMNRLGLGYLALNRLSDSLSAGETQRIRLATQIGSGLRDLIYILDEPSAGLHARDSKRLIEVLRELQNQGNTILVVEHDEDVIRMADWAIDLGPHAGRDGGELLYSGPIDEFCKPGAAPKSLTAAWLREGSAGIYRENRQDPRQIEKVKWLYVHDAKLNNLNISETAFPLGCFTVVSGVSGAGKSSLVRGIVGDSLEKLLHRWDFSRTVESCGHLSGWENLDKVIIIDQNPIGRTSRSNAATYTKLFDALRDLFSKTPEAITLGLEKSHFSFNVDGGRCNTCEGSGVREIGMHFLGSVEIPCETCQGQRFRDEVLRVLYRGKSISDILRMTVDEALAFFSDQVAPHRILTALSQVGLGYLPLGQSSTTLSGGEGQRVKLAAELCRTSTGRTFYVLDEPTTGLHHNEVCRLIDIIRKLTAGGNTVVVVEHHLDIIEAADWVIDLGPNSGKDGGRVVAAGTPDEICQIKHSHTGAALAERRRPDVLETPAGLSTSQFKQLSSSPIELHNVTTNNLKNIDVIIPIHQLTVLTGVSGSGKSSLAFDTLYSEAAARFVQHLGTFMRRYLATGNSAEVGFVKGLTSAVAISQKSRSRNPRSTVGTASEIFDFLRILFSRAGELRCPSCGNAAIGGHCLTCGASGPSHITARLLSFNHAEGACPACLGLGSRMRASVDRMITHPEKSLLSGAMDGHKTGLFYGDPHGQYVAILTAVGKALGITYEKPWRDLSDRDRGIAMYGTGDQVYDVLWQYSRGNHQGEHRFQGIWKGFVGCFMEEFERKREDKRSEALMNLMVDETCTSCQGTRLGPWARHVMFAGETITTLTSMSVNQSLAWFRSFDRFFESNNTSEAQHAVAISIRADIESRLENLIRAGLGYLSLGRSIASLSSGEARRLELASRLAGDLSGVTYILDEPTLGLHARDTEMLISILKSLRDLGNTLVVVEHDKEMMRAADYIIEMGPGAGTSGGLVVIAGTPNDIRLQPSSLSAKCLSERGPPLKQTSLSQKDDLKTLVIKGASIHNLRSIDVEFPLGHFIGISGVSGSGKTSLIFDVLAPTLLERKPIGCKAVENVDLSLVEPIIVRCLEVNQSRSSTVATYSGIWDFVRDLFVKTETAKTLSYKKSHFSFHHKDAQCPTCQGLGAIKESLDFLGERWCPCQTCNGTRFSSHVLSVLYRGFNVADTLQLTIQEAYSLLSDNAPLTTILNTLIDLGLDYLRLGQSLTEISGGELQRLQLAFQLHRLGQPKTGLSKKPGRVSKIFLFDEPTRGLHALDVQRLLKALMKFRDRGDTVIVVEHNLDVLASTDWIIDLGPEGGENGGSVVASGTPFEVAASNDSHTGRWLRKMC